MMAAAVVVVELVMLLELPGNMEVKTIQVDDDLSQSTKLYSSYIVNELTMVMAIFDEIFDKKIDANFARTEIRLEALELNKHSL